MVNLEIQKAMGEFNNSPVAKYYDKYGEKRAVQNAVSSLRMKHLTPKIREKNKEKFYTLDKILEAHSKCKTWNSVLKYLEISYQLYHRLCKLYDIQELKADRRITTKLAKQQKVEVWKLIEEEVGLFDSTKKAADKLDVYQGSVHRLASNRGKKDKGKINAAVGPDGSLYTFEFTGKEISDGSKRDPSRQIRAYKLYEVFHKEYDSINDADVDLDVYFAAQLKGICEQTGGYKIYKK